MCEAPRKSEWALEHAKKLTPLPAPDAKSEGASVKQESKCPVKAEKPVKLEPKQDCQPDQQPEDQQRNEVDESMESIMDKAALIALRNLKSCRKTRIPNDSQCSALIATALCLKAGIGQRWLSTQMDKSTEGGGRCTPTESRKSLSLQ